MKILYRAGQVSFYMNSFNDFYPDKITEEDYLRDTKTFVEKSNQRSTPGPFPNHCLRFSYIFKKIMS